MTKRKKPTRRRDTLIVHGGRDPLANHGVINPPVYHASTILFRDVAQIVETRQDQASGAFRQVSYGREGTPTTKYFEEAVAALEGGHRAVVLPCGMGALSVSLMAFLGAGDHLLLPSSVYGRTRDFCQGPLARFGVEIGYYPPRAGPEIAETFKPNTKVVFVESPCSLSFEIQDVPAIVRAAHARGIRVVMDNTWATPLYFRAIEHGIDVSVHAVTKYISGHSDLMLGVAITTEATDATVRKTASQFGFCAGPDDVYAAQRGLRTLAVRMQRHQASALRVAAWLEARPEVARVHYPALPSSPDHAIWKRDFLGASGLFGVEFKPAVTDAGLVAMLDGMALFGLGYSWGGPESLIVPVSPEKARSPDRWQGQGPSVRLHIGLEDVDDLIADLEAGLQRLVGTK
jgi:cystathionine beta-lyase